MNYFRGVAGLRNKKPTMVTILAVLALISAAVSPALAQQAQPTVTRTIGPPQCKINLVDRTMTMTFVAQLNQDPISTIGGCRLNETTDRYYSVPCDFDTFTENGQTYMTVVSVISLDDPSDSAAINPCGFEALQVSPNIYNYKWRLAMRRYEGYLFYGDLDYTFTCFRDLAINTYVSTSIDTVYDSLVQNVPTQAPMVLLTVVSNNNNVPISTCDVGDPIRLRLTMDHGTVLYQDFLTPNGVYVTEARAARSLMDLENLVNTQILIGADGCAEPSSFALTGDGFKLSLPESTQQRVVYYTNVFRCLRYQNTNQLWFSAIFSTCSGLWTNFVQNPNGRCYNYCQFSNVFGRKRRQTSSGGNDLNEEETFAVITIRDQREPVTSEAGLTKTTLVAISVAVAVLVIALLAMGCCFLYFFGARRRTSRKTESGSYPVDSSQASSDRKLPIKF